MLNPEAMDRTQELVISEVYKKVEQNSTELEDDNLMHSESEDEDGQAKIYKVPLY
ncbi:MAG: hypothetical protein AAGM46_26655 [Cyanobacteria bacterium J06582_2]